MTTSEQQAAPVAQELNLCRCVGDEDDRPLTIKIRPSGDGQICCDECGMPVVDDDPKTFRELPHRRMVSYEAYWKRFELLASLPCKSGEGARAVPVEQLREWYTGAWATWLETIGDGDDDEDRPTPAHLNEMEALLSAPTPDATQTREAELVAAVRNEVINTPETADFMAGVPIEAMHQRERWATDHDAGKTPFDWFWLIGYLAQKAATAQVAGDTEKALHHTISTAAALANWHLAITGADTSMRPGIADPDATSSPDAAGSGGEAREKLQQTWDLMSSLPPLIFSESEADHLIATIAALTPDPLADAGKPIDATQTREAELLAALELAQPIVEADYDAAKESGDSDWEGMAYTALEAVNAALNDRGGA